MSGREVKEYTNLTDPKDRKYGKGKDKIDEEEITFQRMVSKMQDVSGERGGYLHGRGALDSDDLLYLKEQMEAEQDAERLLRRTEKRAFLAFKISLFPLSLRVEPKAKSGIRQQDLLKRLVEIRPKRQKVSTPAEGKNETVEPSPARANESVQEKVLPEPKHAKPSSSSRPCSLRNEVQVENPVKSLLAVYDSSDDED
ncbi:hypothetical protein LIER_05297 [Lithospermum erythrorhizon]|uniref:Uncharacterized protein n=1 Tax=Lithospermum erythrorhizon TaxID=34254 RepID=A0AAV3P012_LITER